MVLQLGLGLGTGNGFFPFILGDENLILSCPPVGPTSVGTAVSLVAI